MKGTFSTTTPTSQATVQCETPGCTRQAYRILRGNYSGFGRRCNNCKQRWRRNGDARQIIVRTLEVQKWVKRLKVLLRQQADMEKMETYLRDVATRIEDAARSPEAVEALPHSDGRPSPWVALWKQRAVDEILRVLKESDAVESGILVAATFLMRDQERHRFVTDRAFDFQLCRLWRGQAGLAWGTWYNHRTGRTSGYYRELPPRVAEEIVQYLKTAYSRFAGRVVTLVNTPRDVLDEAFRPLRVCASPECGRPNTRRLISKYCSPRCQIREKVRRHHARKKEATLTP